MHYKAGIIATFIGLALLHVILVVRKFTSFNEISVFQIIFQPTRDFCEDTGPLTKHKY